MVRFSYKETNSHGQGAIESIEHLYEMIEMLDQDEEYASIRLEDFSGVYRAEENMDLECVEQLQEVAGEGGKLIEAEAEFVFNDNENSYLEFTYNQNNIVQRAQIESNSLHLVELAEDVIPMEPTIPSKGISYLKDIISGNLKQP